MRDEGRGARDNVNCPAPLTHLLNTYLPVTIVCWALYQLCEPVLCEGTLLLETKICQRHCTGGSRQPQIIHKGPQSLQSQKDLEEI